MSTVRGVQCGHKGSYSDADVRNFLVQNTSDFLEFIVCLHGKGVGWREQVETFCRQGGRGHIFSVLCGHLLLLWTTHYAKTLFYLNKDFLCSLSVVQMDRRTRKRSRREFVADVLCHMSLSRIPKKTKADADLFKILYFFKSFKNKFTFYICLTYHA